MRKYLYRDLVREREGRKNLMESSAMTGASAVGSAMVTSGEDSGSEVGFACAPSSIEDGFGQEGC